MRERKPHLNGAKFERAVAERQAKLGLSQPDMSLLVEHLSGQKCSQNEISRIETGERQRWNPQFLEVFAKILHMPRDAVMYGGAQPKIIKILGEMQENESIREYQEPEPLEPPGLTPDDNTVGYRVGTDTHGQFDLGAVLLCHDRNASFDECFGRWCVVEVEGTRYVGKVEQGASVRVITVRPSRFSNQLLIDRIPTWISPILAISLSDLAACQDRTRNSEGAVIR
jgi:hypothetical protein